MEVSQNEIVKIQKGEFKLTVAERDHLWIHYEEKDISTFIKWEDLTEQEARATELYIVQVNAAARKLKDSLRKRLKLPADVD